MIIYDYIHICIYMYMHMYIYMYHQLKLAKWTNTVQPTTLGICLTNWVWYGRHGSKRPPIAALWLDGLDAAPACQSKPTGEHGQLLQNAREVLNTNLESVPLLVCHWPQMSGRKYLRMHETPVWGRRSVCLLAEPIFKDGKLRMPLRKQFL